MIQSMTGFGAADGQDGDVGYRVEIRSVNNRYFKSAIKLPESLQQFESEIDKLLRSRLGRGSVNYTLWVRDNSPAAAYGINAAALRRYIDQLAAAASGLESIRIDLSAMLEWPGVCQPPELDEARQTAQLAMIRRITEEAIGRLLKMREAEGAALLADLKSQCQTIRRQLEEVRARSPGVVVEYQARLQSRVRELLAGTNVKLSEDDLVREVSIFAERCDVNEEISRLSSHLAQFLELCDSPEDTGRRLDFLAQELLREANTIGSKANDAQIARQIVDIKAAIDRIKEQVQNVA